ncbi:MAG: hydantoinase/oxoprolinase family protein [Methyloceanibacter sp.]
MAASFGWDLGGANLKLARAEDGGVTQVHQISCPILADRTKFDLALSEAVKLCTPGAVHAVTMTGELSDVFPSRAEGCAYLVAMMRKATHGEAAFYSLQSGLVDAGKAVDDWPSVASANWHASAAISAAACPDGLLVDIGTTTTDLIPLRAGAPAARGLSDGERLAESELVYGGVVRTPVMAIAQQAPFAGRMQGIAAERFATMADVYRLVGDLAEDADLYPAADRGGRSMDDSAARLARMLGRDRGEAAMDKWVALARYFAECQGAQIEAAACKLIARESLGAEASMIGAGCGRFLARRLATRLGRHYRDFAETIDCAPEAREMASRCAPAVAVALLSCPR